MEDMYTMFDSSLPSDSQNKGPRTAQPGFNVACRIQEELEKRGHQVTPVEKYLDVGWSFLIRPIRLFRLKANILCLLTRSGGERNWLLMTEQTPVAVINQDDTHYLRLLGEIRVVLSEPVFTNLGPWITRRDYVEMEREAASRIQSKA